MAIRMPRILYAKQMLKKNTVTASATCPTAINVPKGYCAVYVGQEEMKRFVIPLSFLNQPLFQDLLNQSEEEFGFGHPMGGLTIPCRVEAFVDLTSHLIRLV